MNFRPIAAAAVLLAAAASAHATLTTFTNAATFVSLTGASVDDFSDLTINADLGTATLPRTVGAYGYSVLTETGLYTVPVASALALSTGVFSDTLTIASFSSPVLAVGLNAYATNILGEVTGGALTVLATDINGLTRSISLAGGSASGFAGFVSDTPIASLKLSMTTPNTNAYASLDNVAISAVPEPGPWLMLLAGGGVMLRAASRRRA